MLGVPTELDNNRTPVTLKGQKRLDRHQFRIRLFLKFPLWPVSKFNINREWENLKELIRKTKSWNSEITYLPTTFQS